MAFVRHTSAPAARQRFSLLLLEPGEIYFEDHSVYYHPDADGSDGAAAGGAAGAVEAAMKRKSKGRLKVCSQSLVFDPHETSEPVVKFPFKNALSVAPLRPDLRATQEVLVITCERTLEMLADETIAPYVIRRERREHRFSLNFVQLSAVLQRVQELFHISKLPIAERERETARLVVLHTTSKTFDPSWLVDLHEKMLLELSGNRITPLVSNPGRIMLTNARLYFQPCNNVDPEPVHKFALPSITRVIKRRHLLRQTAIEIFTSDGRSIFLSFKDRVDRDQFHDTLMRQPELSNLERDSTENYTLKWQNGLISNFDYLMYLNSMADRTINDLTQYPVFPWILSNYSSETLDLDNPKNFRDLSKPIGALDPERLKVLKKRFHEMPEPKFLYGTHYSTPGYVLYYLVRVAPQYMLCLQNGKFDTADRLFCDVGQTWTNVLTNQGDVKELIPEFFQPVDNPEDNFLLNTAGLNLGVRQSQTKVHDVTLPKWATDANDFLIKHRAALESDHVSRNLHKWIDLIFGYKQRGEEAIRADNLFYYLTYEGAVDIDAITDPGERSVMELQINEFGQTPKQLFKIPHPRRLVKDEAFPSLSKLRLGSDGFSFTSTSQASLPSPATASSVPDSPLTGGPAMRPLLQSQLSSRTSSSEGLRSLSLPTAALAAASAISETRSVHWADITGLTCTYSYKLHKEPVTSVCLAPDGDTIYSVSADSSLKIFSIAEKKQVRSINVCELALSCCALSSDGKSIFVGSWDNNIYVYNSDYGRILDTLSGHDDAVSCLQLRASTLLSGSWDSTIKIWDCPMASGDNRRCQQKFEFTENESEVKAVDINLPRTRAASGSNDGKLMIIDLMRKPPACLAQLEAHTDTINAVVFTPDSRCVISGGSDGWLKMFEVDGGEVFAVDAGEAVRCLLTNGQFVIAGCEGGALRVWELVTGKEVAQFKGHQGAVTCLVRSSDGRTIISGGDDCSVRVWSLP